MESSSPSSAANRIFAGADFLKLFSLFQDRLADRFPSRRGLLPPIANGSLFKTKKKKRNKRKAREKDEGKKQPAYERAHGESETTKEEQPTEIQRRARGNERVTLQVEAWRVGETLSR